MVHLNPTPGKIYLLNYLGYVYNLVYIFFLFFASLMSCRKDFLICLVGQLYFTRFQIILVQNIELAMLLSLVYYPFRNLKIG